MKEFRTRSGETQSDSAARAGVDVFTWARWERGERVPNLANAHKVENATGGQVRAEWFTEPVARTARARGAR